MNKNLKLTISTLVLFVCITVNTQAQFGKKLKEQFTGGSSSKTSEKEEEVEVSKDERNEWAKAHEGQVLFYNKMLKEKDSSMDSESGLITSAIISSNTPVYFRAYLNKDYKTVCDGCTMIDVRFTLGGESISTQELRNEMPAYYRGMASALGFYDYKNRSIGVPLEAEKGYYIDMYTLQEDAYRILLSRIKDKLVKGADLTLKVEVFAMKDKIADPYVLASGELKMTIADESYNLQNLNCRCGKPGMTDANVIKEVKAAFLFQFEGVEKVFDVVLLDRDFTLNYDNSYPTKNVVSKGMWANIVYLGDNGIYMMVKRYIFFKSSGSGFSSKASIGEHSFYLPVSPTCAK